jgi:hypothetical protein
LYPNLHTSTKFNSLSISPFDPSDDPSYENNFSSHPIISFIHLKYLNLNTFFDIAIPTDEYGQLEHEHQQQFNLFLSNLPVTLLAFHDAFQLENKQVEIILQRCPLIAELTQINSSWKGDHHQYQYEKLHELLRNHQHLQTLKLEHGSINLLLPSLYSIINLTELDISQTDIVDDEFQQICSTLKNIKIIKFKQCDKLTTTNIISSLKLLSSTLTYFHTDEFHFTTEQIIDLLFVCKQINNFEIINTQNSYNISSILTYLFDTFHCLPFVDFCVGSITKNELFTILSKCSLLQSFDFQCQLGSEHRMKRYFYKNEQSIYQLKYLYLSSK